MLNFKSKKIFDAGSTDMSTSIEVLRSMASYSAGKLHDINHFMKVWGYARRIGELEALDEKTQRILEIAAITHDIACPLCREKYANTDAALQEKEGVILAGEFLKDFPIWAIPKGSFFLIVL